MMQKFKIYKENYMNDTLFSIENSSQFNFIPTMTVRDGETFTLGDVEYKIINNHNTFYLNRLDINESIRIYNKVELLIVTDKNDMTHMKRIIVPNNKFESMLQDSFNYYNRTCENKNLNLSVKPGLKIISKDELKYITDGDFKYINNSLAFSDYNYLFIVKKNKINSSYVSNDIVNNDEKIFEIKKIINNYMEK